MAEQAESGDDVFHFIPSVRICKGCARPEWQVESEGHLDGCKFAPVATTAKE